MSAAVSRPITFAWTDSAATLSSSNSVRPSQGGRHAVSQAMRVIMLNPYRLIDRAAVRPSRPAFETMG